MNFVIAGAILVGALIVARALGKVERECMVLRMLLEHVAVQHGLDYAEYMDDIMTVIAGLPSTRQILKHLRDEEATSTPASQSYP